jgi:hypothetical protein
MGLTPETGALVPVPVEGQEQGASGSNAAAAAAAGDGDGLGEESDGDGASSSSSSSDGSDLGEIASDEIEAYIRPRSAVKIQEVRVGCDVGVCGGAAGDDRGVCCLL